MAQFTRTNGDFQPVLHVDYASYTNSGVNTNTAGAAVQPQGPKLDFFSLTANASLASAGNVNGYLQNVFQAIQSGAGITNGGAGGTVAM